MKKLLYVIPGIHVLLAGWLSLDTISFLRKLIVFDWSRIESYHDRVSLYCLWGIEINDFIYIYDAPKYLIGMCIITLIAIAWAVYVCIATHEKIKWG